MWKIDTNGSLEEGWLTPNNREEAEGREEELEYFYHLICTLWFVYFVQLMAWLLIYGGVNIRFTFYERLFKL